VGQTFSLAPPLLDTKRKKKEKKTKHSTKDTAKLRPRSSFLSYRLTEGCRQSLLARNVEEGDIVEVEVPGSYELPFAANCLARSGAVIDAIVCIGCLIKGQTAHFENISSAVSHGVMRVGIETGVPVIFGVLTCLTEQQALERTGLATAEGEECSPTRNHGLDWGNAAVDMALIARAARPSNEYSAKLLCQ
jgi:6,7-dimethyl-8-ribityllumazine synthase